MGRTSRKRCRKSVQSTNLCHDPDLVNMRKWMHSISNFSDPLQLQLRHFVDTGRGITSKNCIKKNDVLISVPFSLLISLETVVNSRLLEKLTGSEAFTIHEILAFYLLVEKHIGEKSHWKYYINSLPFPEPYLPWLSGVEDIKHFPKDLKLTAEKLQANFQQSFQRLRKSISPSSLCECCEKPLHSVLELRLFKWSYVMVNTRAVYVDPDHYAGAKNIGNLLSDEPSMALCPFLDMFNHDCYAQTEAKVTENCGERFYELKSLISYQRYDQYFISYGAHDNEKLLMEYGFYIPGNCFDSVKFNFEEVVNVLNLNFNKHQYVFIRNNKLIKNLYFSHIEGTSFNLKAIIFVANNPDELNYSKIVFSDYPQSFVSLVRTNMKILLEYKMKIAEADVKNCKKDSASRLVEEYVIYRLAYLQKMELVQNNTQDCNKL